MFHGQWHGHQVRHRPHKTKCNVAQLWAQVSSGVAEHKQLRSAEPVRPSAVLDAINGSAGIA